MERVNSVLYRLLKGCLSSDVKVYPGIAEEDAKFPYIVYNQDSFQAKSTKDGIYKLTFQYGVDVWSDTFNESDKYATEIAFGCSRLCPIVLEDPAGCLRIVLAEGSADYSEGGFVQRLLFDVQYQVEAPCVE